MKYIVKGKQPPALIPIHKDKKKVYKDTKDNVSEKTTVKTDILKALLRDQGYICCYCMQELKIDGLTSVSPLYPTIEHYIAQSTQESKDKNLDTDYKNMLATCHGNDKVDPDNKHCDSSRKAIEFKFLNPLDKSCERVLGYGVDGTILCLDEFNEEDINNDIKTLNLNFQKLKDAREAIIKGISIAKKIERNRLKNKFNKANFKEKELKKCQIENGKFKPFVQVMIYELNKI